MLPAPPAAAGQKQCFIWPGHGKYQVNAHGRYHAPRWTYILPNGTLVCREQRILCEVSMGAAADFSEIPAFQVLMAGEQRVPFVFNFLNSGWHYPSWFLALRRLECSYITRSDS